MGIIKTGFQTPWEVRIPVLTRYLDTEFVDLFFNEGKLRLSSFKSFRNNPDEQRGDINEGRMKLKIRTPQGSNNEVAQNCQEAYVLCAGTVENPTMETSFSTQDSFRITNSLDFADCISRHIPGCNGGMEGLCHYRDHLTFSNIDTITTPEESCKFMSGHLMNSFLLKHNKYAHQGEYRFIWFTSGKLEMDYIDIVCPEALEFCERLK